MQEEPRYEAPMKTPLYDGVPKITIPVFDYSGPDGDEALAGSDQVATLESDARIMPDLLSRLSLANRFGKLEDPSVSQYITEHEFRQFALNTGLNVPGADDLLGGNTDYRDAISGGLLAQTLLLLTGLRLHETHGLDQEVKIPVAELHCPHVENCTATYTEKRSRGRDFSLKLEVAGNGVGTSLTQSIGFSESVTTKGECLSLYKRARVAVQEWRGARDQEALYFLKIVSLIKGLSSEPVDASAYHLCGDGFQEMDDHIGELRRKGVYQDADLNKMEISSPQTTQGYVMEVKRGVMINSVISLPLGLYDLPAIKLQLSVKSEVIREMGLSGSVQGGYNYLGFYVAPDRSNVNWAWSPVR